MIDWANASVARGCELETAPELSALANSLDLPRYGAFGILSDRRRVARPRRETTTIYLRRNREYEFHHCAGLPCLDALVVLRQSHTRWASMEAAWLLEFWGARQKNRFPRPAQH